MERILVSALFSPVETFIRRMSVASRTCVSHTMFAEVQPVLLSTYTGFFCCTVISRYFNPLSVGNSFSTNQKQSILLWAIAVAGLSLDRIARTAPGRRWMGDAGCVYLLSECVPEKVANKMDTSAKL